MSSVLEGIKQLVSSGTTVVYEKGAEYADDGWPETEIMPSDPTSKGLSTSPFSLPPTPLQTPLTGSTVSLSIHPAHSPPTSFHYPTSIETPFYLILLSHSLFTTFPLVNPHQQKPKYYERRVKLRKDVMRWSLY